MHGVITLKNHGACWASIGLRSDKVLSMADTDFIVAQVLTTQHTTTQQHSFIMFTFRLHSFFALEVIS
jgi:hypothetical protein